MLKVLALARAVFRLSFDLPLLLALCPPYGRGWARANSQVNSVVGCPLGKQWASTRQAGVKSSPQDHAPRLFLGVVKAPFFLAQHVADRTERFVR